MCREIVSDFSLASIIAMHCDCLILFGGTSFVNRNVHDMAYVAKIRVEVIFNVVKYHHRIPYMTQKECRVFAGEALSIFNVKCTDWKDDNQPSGKLKYTYAYQLRKEVVAFTTTHPILPLGDPNDNFRITILVRIENQYGTANTYSMPVKVCICIFCVHYSNACTIMP